MMLRRLLVGLADPGPVNDARQYLIDLAEGMRGSGIEVQVAFFDVGETGHLLFQVADVRSFGQWDPFVESPWRRRVARRFPALTHRLLHGAAAENLDWVRQPDRIHLHGARAARILRYAPAPGVPVTTFLHGDDPGVDALDRADRELLLARTDRFLLAEDLDGGLAAGLLAAGVPAARIEPAPEPPVRVPERAASAADRARARRAAGLPDDAVVVAVPGINDWPVMPDMTPTLAWELERLAGEAAPILLWYGVPDGGELRWCLDYDIERMGLRTLRPVEDLPVDVLDVADVLVIPLRLTVELPERFVDTAAAHRIPVACWDGDPLADDVRRAGGIVVERADVRAMATELARITTDPAALQLAGERAEHTQIADFERLLALDLPAR